ncbi:VOC family protein [Microbispora sp. NPDC088329]|uniref:VOC family protein n=1 Tax=Microbispora sp. NPDC088329 TaxID=3154869 RepID=UPI00341D9302
MSGDDLLSIGVFALVSGLSIHALRHYDELGLLRPAVVDPVTGYRRYRPEQVRHARLICALRRVDVPIDAVRVVMDDPDGEALRTVLRSHRERLMDRAQVLSRMVHVVDHYIEHGVAMPDLKTPRIVQVTVTVADLAESISFYRAAFDAVFNEEISSFQFGAWPSEDFFLLTVAHELNEHGRHDGPAGVSRFGLLVDDVDAAHRRAVDAGAVEVHPPADQPWKPRSSCVTDPSGNRIDLYQG